MRRVSANGILCVRRFAMLSIVWAVAASAVVCADPSPFTFSPPAKPGLVAQVCLGVLGAVGIAPPSQGPTQEAADILKARGITTDYQLGAGGMASVFVGSGIDKRAQPVTVIIKQPHLGKANVDAIRREYVLMKRAYPHEDIALIEGVNDTVLLVMRVFPRSPAAPSEPARTVKTALDSDPRFTKKHRDADFVDGVANALVDAMRAVHATGIIHADIKPDNALLQVDGARVRARLIDFGISVASDESGIPVGYRGSPGFSGMEALAGQKFTEARDVYAMQQTLLRIYYRDYYDSLKTKDKPLNSVERGFPGLFHIKDMDFTPERNQEGVSPQIAWTLRSMAFRNSKDFAEMLAYAQKSTDMAKFLQKYADIFKDSWAVADAGMREALVAEIASSPLYRKDFAGYLSKDVRREMSEVAAQMQEDAETGQLVLMPFGNHTKMGPRLQRFRLELDVLAAARRE